MDTLLQRIDDKNNLPWRREVAEPPPGDPLPLDPENPDHQEKLGAGWNRVPEAIRPDAVWLPAAPELKDMMYGWNGKTGIRDTGEPLDGWENGQFLYAAWDLARDPEGITRCGMDDNEYGTPLEPECDRRRGCFRAYGERPNPKTGGSPKEIQVHLRGDGRIMDTFAVPMD